MIEAWLFPRASSHRIIASLKYCEDSAIRHRAQTSGACNRNRMLHRSKRTSLLGLVTHQSHTDISYTSLREAYWADFSIDHWPAE